jgi:hypothetical protein
MHEVNEKFEYIILAGKHEGQRPFRRPRNR